MYSAANFSTLDITTTLNEMIVTLNNRKYFQVIQECKHFITNVKVFFIENFELDWVVKIYPLRLSSCTQKSFGDSQEVSQNSPLPDRLESL